MAGDQSQILDMRDRILEAMLPHVAFDGWTRRSLEAGAIDAGFERADGQRAFPAGTLEVVEHFCDFGDRRMVEAVEAMDLESLRVRDRIVAALRARLEGLDPHREGVRRALSFLALPHNSGAAIRATYRTVDAIWYAVGDRSTDFSFYTKRALLAGVYASTVLCWVTDESPDHLETWAFLERRIDGVMKISRRRPRYDRKIRWGMAAFARRCAARIVPFGRSPY